MGQSDVLELLQELRKKNNKWYILRDIKRLMYDKGYSNGVVRGVSSDLLRLSIFNLIKIRGVGVWDHHKEFQAYATILQGNGNAKKLKKRK